MLEINNNNSNSNNCCHHRQATRTLLVLVVFLLLGVDTTVAKGGSRGGSRGGGSRGGSRGSSSSSFSSSGTSSTYTGSSSSFGSTGSSSSSYGSGSSNSKYGSSSSSGNKNIPMAAPATPVRSYGSSGNKNIPVAAPATPVRSYGGGYASSNSFNNVNNRNQNSRSSYPTNGYNNNLLYGMGGFYLGSSYRRNSYNNNNNEDDENYDQYFDRMENGCQLTGVESYRTIDNNNNNNTSSPSIWTGCSEEWRYNVEVILNKATSSSIRVQNFTFVSPPIELYVCSKNDSCASCQEELNGKNFDALTLEALNTQNGTYLIDCYVPKNLTTVNKTFDCINDECVFISEKYTTSSSSALSSFWTTVVMTSGLAVTLFYSMLG